MNIYNSVTITKLILEHPQNAAHRMDIQFGSWDLDIPNQGMNDIF